MSIAEIKLVLDAVEEPHPRMGYLHRKKFYCPEQDGTHITTVTVTKLDANTINSFHSKPVIVFFRYGWILYDFIDRRAHQVLSHGDLSDTSWVYVSEPFPVPQLSEIESTNDYGELPCRNLPTSEIGVSRLKSSYHGRNKNDDKFFVSIYYQNDNFYYQLIHPRAPINMKVYTEHSMKLTSLPPEACCLATIPASSFENLICSILFIRSNEHWALLMESYGTIFRLANDAAWVGPITGFKALLVPWAHHIIPCLNYQRLPYSNNGFLSNESYDQIGKVVKIGEIPAYSY